MFLPHLPSQVSLGKRRIQNVTTQKEKIPNKRTKQ
jgi:hypothetical protein